MSARTAAWPVGARVRELGPTYTFVPVLTERPARIGTVRRSLSVLAVVHWDGEPEPDIAHPPHDALVLASWLEPAPAAEGEAPPTRRPPWPVLLVDDDDDVRIALQAFLRASGCVVSGVRDGADALREVGAFAPAVVLLDLHLDDMDGREVARRIRRERPSLPLVALSGYDPGEGGDDGPFCAHLVKPVDLDRLRALIHELSARAEGPAV